MKIITLDASIYGQEIYVLISDSASKVTKHINEKFKGNIDKLPDEGNTCRGFQWKTLYSTGNFEKARFFVFIHDNELRTTTPEHEFIHLTWSILDHVGIELSYENHEAFTYLFEHLLNQFRTKVYGRNYQRTKKSEEEG